MRRRNIRGNMHLKSRQARGFRKEMTSSERLLWSRLRGNRLIGLHFRRQHVIQGFIVDFYCHEARLIVEIDGGIHRSQTENDIIRDKILGSLQFTVLRFSKERLGMDFEGVIRDIRDICLRKIPELLSTEFSSSGK